MKNDMSKILVIGDTHINASDDLVRFHLLAKLIVDTEPEVIIIIGDFLTLDSLSAWDRDKRQRMEGRRYKDEIKRGNDALDILISGILEINRKKRKRKKGLYIPDIIYIEGNHEDRLKRYLEMDPTFAGAVSVPQDLLLVERGIKWIPYRDYYFYNGIGFTHIPHNTVKPITGKYHIHRAMENSVESVVYGHTHKLEMACRHLPGMRHLQQTLSVGCFFDKDEEYVSGLITNYWKGLIMLHNYKEGRYDIETYSSGRLRRMYADT